MKCLSSIFSQLITFYSSYGQRISYQPWNDQKFKKLLSKAKNRIGRQRAFILVSYLENTLSLDEHVYECGVYKGGTAYLIAETLDKKVL